MLMDWIYAYFVSGSWMFLVGWALMLVMAFFNVFRREL